MIVKCSKCGIVDANFPDSVPYCPKCGKPITPDEIAAGRDENRADIVARYNRAVKS